MPALAYRKLSATYHRGLRRIAGMCRHQHAEKITDEQVRIHLNMPSLACFMVRRRLLLAAAVSRSELSDLKVLLAVRAVDGSPIAWTKQVQDDFRLLARFHSPKLDELGDPVSNACAWASFICSYPQEFAALVRKLVLHTMPLDKVVGKISKIESQASTHKCLQCGAGFQSRKALLTHIRVKHHQCSDTSRVVGVDPVCPVCMTRFSSRTRLLAHLAETRVRGKRVLTCGTVVRAGLVAHISPDDLATARLQDRHARSDSRKRGHTQPLASWPAKRLCSGGTLAAAAAQAQKRLRECLPELVPSNAVDWQALKPTKRIRGKTSLDTLILNSELALPSVDEHAPT